jgi:hypothetical protein
VQTPRALDPLRCDPGPGGKRFGRGPLGGGGWYCWWSCWDTDAINPFSTAVGDSTQYEVRGAPRPRCSRAIVEGDGSVKAEGVFFRIVVRARPPW